MLLAGALFLVASACQSTPDAGPREAEPEAQQPAGPPPNASHIPAGTVLTASLAEELSRRATKVGDAFTVTVQNALVAENRDTVIASGAVITGLVTGVGSAGEQAAIRLNFTRIALGGVSHPFTAKITTTQLPTPSQSATGEVAVPLGAVIGEGELRTTLLAGPFGAGAGTIISLGIGPDQRLPAGTVLTLQTVDRIQIEIR